MEPGNYYVLVKKGDAKSVESDVDYSIQVMTTETQEIVAPPTMEPDTGEGVEDNEHETPAPTKQPEMIQEIMREAEELLHK